MQETEHILLILKNIPMDYHISYLSQNGHAKELAYCFKLLFPSRTPVLELSKTNTDNCKIYLIGFEYSDYDSFEIPNEIERLLRSFNNKEILLFATCPNCINENLRLVVERKIGSVIPADCIFHGLFLCQGEICKKEIEKLALATTGMPRNAEERKQLSDYRKSKGHPNREDIRRGYRFISSNLKLDTYI